MENLEKLTELLKKVKVIQEREKELSILRGEHFNVFRILGMEADEAGLHTKFLFELLDPDGSHGKGQVFFDAFLANLSETTNGKIEIPSYSRFVEKRKEKSIGRVDDQFEDGGQIDLYFETDTFALVIENKIYSSLGKEQLERYRNYLKSKAGKHRCLILLTPFAYKYQGKLKEGEDFHHLKYESLLPWLDFCTEKSADSPILRETVRQYIITVKGILGKLNSQEMNNELKDLMNSYYDQARMIHDNFINLRDNLKTELFLKTIENLNALLSHRGEYEKIELSENQIYANDNGFSIRKPEWVKGLSLYFEGDRSLANQIRVQIFFDRRNWTDDSLEQKYGRELRDRVNEIKKPEKPGERLDRITYDRFNLNRFFEKLRKQNIDSTAQDFANELMRYLNEHEKTIESLNGMLKENGFT